MSFKIALIFCVQALLVNSVFSQCLGRPIGPIAPYGLDNCGYLASSTGGGFPVTSISPIVPTGITVVSENKIEGIVNVGGEVPFLAAVALEGILPTTGAGAINYGCGNGPAEIVSEGPIVTGIVGPAYPAIAPGPFGSGVNGPIGLGLTGYNGLGCGCSL